MTDFASRLDGRVAPFAASRNTPVCSVVATLDVPVAANGGASLRNRQTVAALADQGPVHVVSSGVTGTGDVPGAATSLGWTHEALATDRSWATRVHDRSWYVRPGAHWRADMMRSAESVAAVTSLADDVVPDLVVCSQWPAAPHALAARGRSGAALVFDTHNVEADLRRATDGSVSGFRARQVRSLEHRRLARWERRLGTLADEVWVCSAEDADRWISIHGAGARLRVVPNTVDTTRPAPWRPPDAPRMLLTGSMSYPPNLAAAEELADEVLPSVRSRVPDVTLGIVGRETPPELRARHDPSRGLDVIGPVPSMALHLASASCIVVPLRSGGGTRLKILEALAFGVPVVSTPLGAEGIDLVDGEHALLAESASDLADAVTTVLEDEDLAVRLSVRGRDLVEARYGTTTIRDTVAASLRDLGVV